MYTSLRFSRIGGRFTPGRGSFTSGPRTPSSRRATASNSGRASTIRRTAAENARILRQSSQMLLAGPRLPAGGRGPRHEAHARSVTLAASSRRRSASRPGSGRACRGSLLSPSAVVPYPCHRRHRTSPVGVSENPISGLYHRSRLYLVPPRPRRPKQAAVVLHFPAVLCPSRQARSVALRLEASSDQTLVCRAPSQRGSQ